MDGGFSQRMVTALDNILIAMKMSAGTLDGFTKHTGTCLYLAAAFAAAHVVLESQHPALQVWWGSIASNAGMQGGILYDGWAIEVLNNPANRADVV
jgi:hypothetical protein